MNAREQTSCCCASAPHVIDKPKPKISSPTSAPQFTFCADNTSMPPYDSDSSDDGEDYTETNVLLGYAAKEPSGDSVSHLGGTPVRSSHTQKVHSSNFRVDMAG